MLDQAYKTTSWHGNVLLQAILSSGTTLNISLQKLKCDKDQSPSILPTGGNLASLTPYCKLLVLGKIALF